MNRNYRLRKVVLCSLSVVFLSLLTSSVDSHAADSEAGTGSGVALEAVKYPYPVHFKSLEIEGQKLRMAYMDVPPAAKSNGRTVVLLHGKNMGGYYWKDSITVLNAAGYRVIVPDQIGWGKSSKPDIQYRFDLLATNTAQLLDELGLAKVDVIGHSTGGMLAVRFARTYPDKVDHLILEDPIGLEDYRRSIPPQSDETLFQEELKNTNPDSIKAFFAHYFAKPHPELSDPLADIVVGVTTSGEWPRWAKASMLAYQMIYHEPVCYEFDLIKSPVLLVVGNDDRTVVLKKFGPPELTKTMGNFPELARRAVSQMPHGTLLIVPNCGHIPHLEQPAMFHQAILDFLKN
jgi:pimeloyl-ACP methyl ester carboxylesterase